MKRAELKDEERNPENGKQNSKKWKIGVQKTLKESRVHPKTTREETQNNSCIQCAIELAKQL